MFRTRILVASGLILGAIALGVASDGAVAAPAPQQSVTVEMASGPVRFEPVEIVVTPGTTVIWRTVSGSHTTTSDTGVWDSVDRLPVGESFSYTFNTAGEFPYYCTPHKDQGMVGKVTVRS